LTWWQVRFGIDPHKISHTAVMINAAEEPLGELQVRALLSRQSGGWRGRRCGQAGPGRSRALAGRVTCWPSMRAACERLLGCAAHGSRAGRGGDGAGPQPQRQLPLLHCPMRSPVEPATVDEMPKLYTESAVKRLKTHTRRGAATTCEEVGIRAQTARIL
jgi:hypothetical protein